MTKAIAKTIGRIVLQLAVGTAGAIIIGIAGILLGANIGGNFGFFGFGGAYPGWEAGGVFFGLLGIALGGLAGVAVVQNGAHEQGCYLAALLGAGAGFVIDFSLYDYNAPALTLVLILLIPPSLVLLGIHCQSIAVFACPRKAAAPDRTDG